MKIADVMHKGAKSVSEDESLANVAKCMRESDIGAVPVMAKGKLVGMITDRDIVCRAMANGKDLARLTAKDLMTRDVICCSPEEDITSAIAIMETRKIRRLPVADKQKSLIGMLSLGDLSHKLSRETSGEVLQAVSGHHE